ncbi:MAG: flagellar motor protein MotB, partial [Spirochaetia bacterium]|nr:flagellar motor protein MotB [Spirochaetia bacterium]
MKNIKIIMMVMYLTLCSALWISADDGTRSKDFYSPYFLGGTASVTQLISPQSEALNPAAGGRTQRVTLDLSYIGIVGEEGDITGFNGHGINIGNTVPTKAGVFSWSGHFLTSQYSSVYADPTFSLNGSFSKELYPDFLVGAGVKFAGSIEPGVSAMADLGVISLIGNLGPFKDFRWGVVLQDLGYSGISTAYPDPFSLSGGLHTNLLDTNLFKINAYADLGLIGLIDFKTIILTLGSEITFNDTITLNIGSRLDSYDLINNNPYSIIPSIGLHYSFKTNITEESTFLGITDRGWNKNEVNVHSGFSMISQNLWAAGLGVNIPLGLIDKQAPVIKLDISGFETEENPDSAGNIDKEDDTVSFYSDKKNPVKSSILKTTSMVRSESKKFSGKNYNITKKVENGDIKYTGRYDKRYIESGISFYISPNNDGVKDDLTFPINISDTRYLKGYAFIIKDIDGNIIREIRNKENRVENQGFTGFFDRLFSIESGIEIPEEFRWDGLNDNGMTVSDGIFYFSVEAWDDNGNIGRSDSFAIVIDSKLPDLELIDPKEDLKIFSPNGDNNKDTFKIFQTGSDEDLWEAFILDSSGNKVKTFNFINDVPLDIEWDGTNDSGNMTLDGVYSYKISSLDRAGNYFNQEISNIIKNTEETPISINIDKSFFSPNNDMILDTLIFTPDIPVSNGILNWNIIILDSYGTTRRKISGDGSLPENILFDGRDSDGIILEEGTYSCKIDVLYISGNHPDSVSPIFNIDVSSPVATVKSNSSIFSPNGDNLKDEIIFYQESSTELIWTGLIKSEDGKIVDEFQWFPAADPIVNWNGTLPNGRLSPDGIYTYQLLSIDRAGNAGQSEIVEFTLNTEETPLILTTDLKYFSPNGDSVQDKISLIPDLKVIEGIASYSLDILDSKSSIIRNFSGTTNLPDKFLWDGIRSNGRVAEDGTYVGRISIIYKKGNAPTSQSHEFVIDTVYPEISISSEYILFSPDSDGKKDILEIKQNSSSENLWLAEVSLNDGSIIRKYFWKGLADNFSWDGKDDSGNLLPDGKYKYLIYSSDKAGNKTSAQIENINIDTKLTAIFLTVSGKYLSPTGNDLFEDLDFSTIVNNKNGLESWSLKMIHENGK